MEQLIKNQNSRRASNIAPHVVSVLQEHSERLLKLEAMMKINNQQQQQPKEEEEELEIEIPEPPAIRNTPEPEPEPEPSINPLIVELQSKLCRITNEADVLTMELNTLKELEDEEETETEIDEDNVSVCTVECREMIKEIKPEMQKIGSWTIDDQCDGCTKKKVKEYKIAKKKKEKERAKAQKAIKLKQQQLIKEEQAQLQKKLKNLKKGREEGYGLDEIKQQQLKEELRKLATDYSKIDNNNSHFSINMYV